MNWSERYDLIKIAKLLNRCEYPLCLCHNFDDDSLDDQITSLITRWSTSNDRKEMNTVRNTLRDKYGELKSLHQSLTALHDTDLKQRMDLGDVIREDDEALRSLNHHNNVAAEQDNILNNFNKLFPRY